MCSIYGAFGYPDLTLLAAIAEAAKDRGRDGGGADQAYHHGGEVSYLGNWRATPTPEVERAQFQPYAGMVHNGTISNDKELGVLPGEVDSMVLARVLERTSLEALVASLNVVKGSYALACRSQRTVFLACNYKPVYYWTPGSDESQTTYFSSMARHFDGLLPFGQAPVKLQPYTALDLKTRKVLPIPRTFAKRAVVVASGGLDSTVVAASLVKEGWEVCLLHFLYGCRAEVREPSAVYVISKRLGCAYHLMTVPYADVGDSGALTNETLQIAGPVEGAEYAHEWVPARNMVFVSLAMAYAEANGYHAVALGNNLEEAGAYPDNEEEFTNILDQAAPYAVQNGYSMRVLSPVGNLMKHEIVKLGLSLSAPLDLTWSCYRGGKTHCGSCGPCFMRREAFKRCGGQDPVFYEGGRNVQT